MFQRAIKTIFCENKINFFLPIFFNRRVISIIRVSTPSIDSQSDYEDVQTFLGVVASLAWGENLFRT